MLSIPSSFCSLSIFAPIVLSTKNLLPQQFINNSSEHFTPVALVSNSFAQVIPLSKPSSKPSKTQSNSIYKASNSASWIALATGLYLFSKVYSPPQIFLEKQPSETITPLQQALQYLKTNKKQKAIEILRVLAIQEENSQAMVELAKIYLENSSNPIEEIIMPLLYQSALLSNPEAYFILGEIFNSDTYVPRQLSTAMEYYRISADLGYIPAMSVYSTLSLFQDRSRDEKSIEMALRLLEKVSQSTAFPGHASLALLSLGTWYIKSSSEKLSNDPPNTQYKGIKALFQSILLYDNTSSMIFLAEEYIKGNIVKSNSHFAAGLFYRAAYYGNNTAKMRLIQLGYDPHFIEKIPVEFRKDYVAMFLSGYRDFCQEMFDYLSIEPVVIIELKDAKYPL